MHNATEHGFHMGLNQFTDMHDFEFENLLGLKVPSTSSNSAPVYQSASDLPKSVDWLKAGLVQPPKNQGKCGSCWAFSAVGAIEGANAIKTGNLLDLSEQQLVDCSHEGPLDDPNQGCHGGWMDSAFEYVVKTPLETEAQYPYKAVDQVCNANPALGAVKLTGFVEVVE